MKKATHKMIAALTKNGWTKRAIAEAIGVSLFSVNHWSSCRSDGTSTEAIARLSTLSGVKPPPRAKTGRPLGAKNKPK